MKVWVLFMFISVFSLRLVFSKQHRLYNHVKDCDLSIIGQVIGIAAGKLALLYQLLQQKLFHHAQLM